MDNLSDSTRRILNDADRIQKRDAWYSRLSNLFNGKPGADVFSISGVGIWSETPADPYSNPEKWVADSLEKLAENIHKTDNEITFVPPILQSYIYGVHFTDKIFGSDVYMDATSGQWYNKYLDIDVGTLETPDLASNETWQIAKRTAEEFVRLDVSLPVFGLPIIASVLNIAVNLFGEKILTAMLTEPEAARHDLIVINNLLIEMHKWYRSVIPERQLQCTVAVNRTEPPGFGQLCGCTTHLVSKEIYADFIAPLDDELLAVYPNGGLIHFCGAHGQHIETFRSMPHLRAVQLNDRAAADLQLYFDGLRDDQIIYICLFDGMPLDKAMEITHGRRLVIQGTLANAVPVS
ncbi:hypothetical protein FACS1894219_06600 [Clostridia bacterium]|nr:hypothetical protein FACS1894219_06600 [Clostridia bacterium]